MTQLTTTRCLLNLLAFQSDAALLSRVQQIDPEGWSDILTQAQHQRVVPLLYDKLRMSPDVWALVPVKSQQFFQARARRISLLCLKTVGELLRLLPRLEAKNIPVIGLKGIHLSEFVYTSRTLRPMRDIDILIHKRDLAAVDAILCDLGYQSAEEKQNWYAENHYHFEYWSDAAQFSIEVHWNIQKSTSAFPIDLASWWQNAQLKQVRETQMRVLAPEEALTHASIHLVNHRCQDGFKSLYDVAMMLNTPSFEVDWQRLLKLAAEQSVNGPIYLTLRLAQDLLNVEVPTNVITQLQDPNLTPAVYDWFKRQISADLPNQHDEFTVSPHFAKAWRTRNPIKKISTLLRSTQLPVDSIESKNESSENTSLAPDTLLSRIRRYSQRIGQLLKGDPALETEIDVLHWLSS
ncbi:MAG: nucleotidyltransferase domain-containing protein [Candidatus Promineifilaceae bacterium]